MRLLLSNAKCQQRKTFGSDWENAGVRGNATFSEKRNAPDGSGVHVRGLSQ